MQICTSVSKVARRARVDESIGTNSTEGHSIVSKAEVPLQYTLGSQSPELRMKNRDTTRRQVGRPLTAIQSFQHSTMTSQLQWRMDEARTARQCRRYDYTILWRINKKGKRYGANASPSGTIPV